MSNMKKGIMLEKMSEKSSLTYLSVLKGTKVIPIAALGFPDLTLKIWFAIQF